MVASDFDHEVGRLTMGFWYTNLTIRGCNIMWRTQSFVFLLRLYEIIILTRGDNSCFSPRFFLSLHNYNIYEKFNLKEFIYLFSERTKDSQGIQNIYLLLIHISLKSVFLYK